MKLLFRARYDATYGLKSQRGMSIIAGFSSDAQRVEQQVMQNCGSAAHGTSTTRKAAAPPKRGPLSSEIGRVPPMIREFSHMYERTPRAFRGSQQSQSHLDLPLWAESTKPLKSK